MDFYKKFYFSWLILAFISSLIAFVILEADFPIFVLLDIIISIIVLLKKENLEKTYLKLCNSHLFIKNFSLNLGAILLVYLIFEPLFGVYNKLLQLSVKDGVDITFGWIVFYPGILGWLILLIFSGTVTLMSEEIFFRGLFLSYLEEKFSFFTANLIQALIFSIPQSILIFIFPAIDSLIYIFVYSIIVIGFIGGYITKKSESVFPTLLAVTLANFIMTVIYLG